MGSGSFSCSILLLGKSEQDVRDSDKRSKNAIKDLLNFFIVSSFLYKVPLLLKINFVLFADALLATLYKESF